MDLICTLNKDFYIPTEYYQTVNNTRMTIHWRKHLVSLKLCILHEQSIKIILDLFVYHLFIILIRTPSAGVGRSVGVVSNQSVIHHHTL